MSGWSRRMLWPETGRTWVLTSPNLPRWEGCLVYPGQVLLEGTNLSEGRGTTTPVRGARCAVCQPDEIARGARAVQAGRSAPPAGPLPADVSQMAGQELRRLVPSCHRPGDFPAGAHDAGLITTIRRLWPSEFAWRDPPYEYETVKQPIDILFGNCRFREALTGTRSRRPPISTSWRRSTAPAGASNWRTLFSTNKGGRRTMVS